MEPMKERCRRVFDKALAHEAIHMIIKQDVQQQWYLAWKQYQGPVGTSLPEAVA
jgi:hypothetical protein